MRVARIQATATASTPSPTVAHASARRSRRRAGTVASSIRAGASVGGRASIAGRDIPSDSRRGIVTST